MTPDWTPQTFVAVRRERLARIAAAAKMDAPIVRAAPIAEFIETARKVKVRLPKERTWFEVLQEVGRGEIRVEDVLKAVAEDYEVLMKDITSQRRTADIVRPRQVAMYLCTVLTTRSTTFIGRKFGHRDHSTVHHGKKKIARLICRDFELACRVEAIKSRITS